MRTNLLGDRGEHLAAEFLERAGWATLHRKFRVGRKEVDLVARRGGVVAFIEVKTRSGVAFGHPLEAITRHKQRTIREVASGWIERFGDDADEYRFDAVSILFNAGSAPRLEYLENAWGT
jgi:putative endonuclease